jgi:peptide/nickel transport system substrate-binding protein
MPSHRFIRALSVLVAAAMTIVMLGSCSMSSNDKGQAGKNSSITIDLTNYPSTLDPGLQYDGSTYPVYRNIYDQLLRRDSTTLKPVPWLAKSWHQSSPTTWTFKLRDDVEFSDGSKLTAEDAAFSLNRILDKSLNSPQYANFSTVDSAKAIDDTTLLIKTKAPSPTLLSFLTTLSVVSKSYAEKVGVKTLNEKPMGSGPYKLDSARGGSELTLTRNQHWWHGKPTISKVVFRAVPNVSSRVADLQSGRAQLALGIEPDQANKLKGTESLQVLAVPTERVAYLALNTLGHTPTANPKVRQAVEAAIDYDSLIKNLVGGYAKRVNAVLTPLSFGYPSGAKPYTYDPKRAKRLLAEAGMPHPDIKFPSSPSYSPQLIQAIQSNLQDVGFHVDIVNTDQATYLKNVQSPKHDWGSIRFGRWSCSCLDADGVIYPLFHSGTVWSSYSSPEFDKTVDSGRTTIDRKSRKALYAKAFSILRRDLPGIGLYQDFAIYGADKNLQWTPDAVESMYVDQMKFAR